MSEESIYAGLEERERLFVAFQTQDRRVWADLKILIDQKDERIHMLEIRQKLIDAKYNVAMRKLVAADTLIECMRNLFKHIIEVFPKPEWSDRTVYRLICVYANGKETV